MHKSKIVRHFKRQEPMSSHVEAKILVVGGGLGGLAAAASLAAAGAKVTLFEKNDKLGGKLNFTAMDGYSFDLGPSIIILPHLFARVFARANRRIEDYVRFVELQPQWRSFFEDGMRLDLHSDMRLMEAELAQLGPGDHGYWSFMEYSRRLYRFAEETYLERGADTVGDILQGQSAQRIYAGIDPLASMSQGVRRFVSEPHLQAMLDFFIKYVGSSSYDAPALMNLLPYSQLGWGLWYVEGGMYNLARGLEKLLRELGVEIHLESEVVALEKQGQRISGLRLASGETFRGDFVVSNMEVIPAYKRLLQEEGWWLKRDTYLYEPAASGLVLHLGVNRTYPDLQHHNFFFSRDPKEHFDAIHRRKELPEDPTIYLVCPTRTDPGLAPEGHDIIKILPHIPYVQSPGFTADAYQALEDRVLDKLERMGLTDLRQHVVTRHRLLPEDLERMYFSNKGAIYGVISDRRRNFSLKAPKQSTRYRNLYFVGGSVNPGAGTPMVVLCGQLVADRILAAINP